MSRLAHTLQDRLGFAGFDLQMRTFIPHLTIGRVRRDQKLKHWLEIKKELSGIVAAMDVSSLTLVQSTLTPTGSLYKKLATFSLQHA